MSPSSLIFVAVVVIWAAYLVVHVSRRREHLATARTVDRFSSQMRVLQRRAVRLDPPAPSSVRISSAGMTRPRPLVAQASPDQLFLETDAAHATHATAQQRAASVRASVLADPDDPREPGSDDYFVDRPGDTGSRLRMPARRPGSRRARLTRTIALGLSLLLLAGTALATLLSALPWWSLAAPVAMLAGVLAWLRAAARALAAQRRREAAHVRRRRAREAEAERERARAARPSAPQMPVAQEFVEPPVVESQVETVETETVEVSASGAQEAPVLVGAGADVATDVVGHTASEEPARRSARRDPLEVAALAHSNIDAERAADPLFADDRWEPTPVPPPTYTMKAKASRPLPEPLEVPVPIEVDDDDIAWDETRHQPRVVGA